MIAVPISSIAKIKPKVNGNVNQTIQSLPLHKTKLILPKDLKVGDTVPKSDNWEAFTVVEIISKKHIVAKFKGSSKLYDIKL